MMDYSQEEWDQMRDKMLIEQNQWIGRAYCLGLLIGMLFGAAVGVYACTS